MVAGGSGITPFYQLLLEFQREFELGGSDAIPQINLISFNKSEKDILLKNELETLHMKGIIKNLEFCVDSTENTTWKGLTGYIDSEKLKKIAWDNSIPNHMVFYCGNDSMIRGILKSLYELKLDNYFKY